MPGYTNVHGFRSIHCLTIFEDGAYLYPIYAMWKDGTRDGLVFWSTDEGETWRLHGAYPRAGGESVDFGGGARIGY